MLHHYTKNILLLIACFLGMQLSAQKTLSFHVGYNTTNSQVMNNWPILNYHGTSNGNMSGLAFNLQYRWYKYDRGFRTLTLHHFSGGEKPVYIDVFNNNTFQYETKKTDFTLSYTTLHYDAAFTIFKSEIDDRFMPYIGAGYFLGFMKSNLGLRKIGLDLNEKYNNLIAGLDIKLGMDYNFSPKWAVNVEVKTMAAFGVLNYAINTQAGILYKLY